LTRVLQSAVAVVIVVLVMVATGLAAEVSGRITDVGELTRDPTAVAGVPWWTGAISRLTNLLWAAAAALNASAARTAPTSHRPPLLLLAALCAALAVDDTLLVHESIMPGHGVPEDLVLVLYAVVALVLAGLWWTTSWRRTVLFAFFGGAAALAVSVAADVIHTVPFVVEDGAKLLGVVIWCLCGAWAHSDMLATGAAHRAVSRPRT
jgi:hypothetical protein